MRTSDVARASYIIVAEEGDRLPALPELRKHLRPWVDSMTDLKNASLTVQVLVPRGWTHNLFGAVARVTAALGHSGRYRKLIASSQETAAVKRPQIVVDIYWQEVTIHGPQNHAVSAADAVAEASLAVRTR